MNRRKFLSTTLLTTAALSSDLFAAPSSKFAAPRGANYVPVPAMNTWQAWRYFSSETIDRDFGYARSVNLDSLRMWLSYDLWLVEPETVEKHLDTLLSLAAKHKLQILLSLTSNCGKIEPSKEMFENKDPATGYETIFPSSEVIDDPKKWGSVVNYIDWFMAKYKNHPHLLAIEIMNEPHNEKANALAQHLLSRAAKQRGSVPLTIGCISHGQNSKFLDHGLDIMQSHPNFALSEKQMLQKLNACAKLQVKHGKPCWATEWQRVRTGKIGWNNQWVNGKDWQPEYAPVANMFAEIPIGGFFWSLTLRPCFLKVHPSKRWLNGLFHEDGSVYSLADARAIARDPKLQLKENPIWPSWAKGVPR